jgi:hypothetical protein
MGIGFNFIDGSATTGSGFKPDFRSIVFKRDASLAMYILRDGDTPSFSAFFFSVSSPAYYY